MIDNSKHRISSKYLNTGDKITWRIFHVINVCANNKHAILNIKDINSVINQIKFKTMKI